MFLDGMMGQFTQDEPRQGGRQQQQQSPFTGKICSLSFGLLKFDEGRKPAPKHPNHGENGSQLDENLKCLCAWAGKTQDVTDNDQMAGGRYGNILGQSFDQAEQTPPSVGPRVALRQRHRERPAACRQQAVEAMMPLMAKEEIFQAAGDLFFRNMDFPGADTIADRLAAMNPLAQIDPKSDIPPQVQMQLAQQEQMIKQMQDQMAAMGLDIKYRQGVEQIKQEGETKRELMRQTSRAHNTETMAEVKVNDQNTRAITSQNKIEIEAIMQLLLHNMDTARLNEEIDRRNREQAQAMQFAAMDISQGGNPLVQQ